MRLLRFLADGTPAAVSSTDSSSITASTGPPAGSAAAPGSYPIELSFLVGLIGLILLGFAAAYLLSPKVGGKHSAIHMSPTFARIYGLLATAGLGTAVAFSSIEEGARNAAYAVLGAIAGYLAGAKTTPASTTTTVSVAAGNGGGNEGIAPPAAGGTTVTTTSPGELT